ncbi:hypothetical protein [Leptothrix ochracea]|uniref:hypothetical protein n=4 Tax=Leptothrix ochracea TaxID=735331 RepID=UPI0034E20BEB
MNTTIRCSTWVLMLGVVAGCSTSPKSSSDRPHLPNVAQRAALGRVALVADSAAPLLTMDGYSPGRFAGGKTAYSSSFRGCMGATGAWALGQAMYASGYALYWATAWVTTVLPCGVVALAGFPVGWVMAPADETLATDEEQVMAMIHRYAAAAPLRRELLRGLQAEPLPKGLSLVTAKDAPDTLLQLSVTSVRFQGPGWGNRPLSLVMEAHVHCLPGAKAVPTKEDALPLRETCHIPLRFVSPSPKKLSAWAANDGAALRQVIQTGIQQFATQTQAALLQGTPPKNPPKARRGEYF